MKVGNLKVGIITLHRVHNFGSALQAYATQKFINKNGFSSEIIDYWRPSEVDDLKSQLRTNYARWNRSILTRFAFYVLRSVQLKKQAFNFRSFIKEYLNTSSKSYYSAVDLSKAADEDFSYNYYCVGSDQVWNTDYHKGGDEIFFLKFAGDRASKFSLASSFGKKDINSKEKRYIKEELSKFIGVSSREASGVSIIGDFGIKADLVIDPTLLISGREWSDFSEKPKGGKKYLFVYQLHRGHNLRDVAKKIAKDKNLEVVTLKGFWSPFDFRSKGIHDTTVRQFLGYIENADHVLTDSFHGTAFSLNFGKRLTVVTPPKYGERLINILNLCGAEFCLYDRESGVVNYEEVNFVKVNEFLGIQRDNAMKFMERMKRHKE